MPASVRRLGPGDERVLALLNTEDEVFDLAGRGGPRQQLSAAAAVSYLSDRGVLHWVAEQDGAVVGHLLCYIQRRRRGDAVQVMVYEIGVRAAYRRRGVGRALLATMREWMREAGVRRAWVLADPDALDFYEACGFEREPGGTVLLRHDG